LAKSASKEKDLERQLRKVSFGRKGIFSVRMEKWLVGWREARLEAMVSERENGRGVSKGSKMWLNCAVSVEFCG